MKAWLRSWKGNLLLFGLALGSGAMTLWSIRQYLHEQELNLAQAHRLPMVQRLVVADDLPLGTYLTEQHLAWRDFPDTAVPSDSLMPEQHLQMLGMRLRTNLKAGDLITLAHVQEQEDDSFSQQLLPGRRAMTIPVDELNSVSGLIRSGDLIDIYISFDEQGKRVTAPLLQSVLVRATGKQVAPDRHGIDTDDYRSLTLDLAPEEALRLVAARQNGRITALLRHPGDHEQSQKAMRGELAHVLGIASQAEAPARRTPEVLYGYQSSGTQANPNVVLPDLLGLIDMPSQAAITQPSASFGWRPGEQP